MLEEGLTLHPVAAPLLLLAGMLREYVDDLDGAERFYRRAVEEDPQLAHAHKALGDAAYRRGAHEEAQRAYTRVIELMPDFSDDVHARLGNLHFRRGEARAARDSWERALRLNPDNEAARSSLQLAAHAVE